MNQSALEHKLATIAAVDPDATDRLMMDESEEINDGNVVALSDVQNELEGYNGRILVRIPRSLHRQLTIDAKLEGVSLNQYALYKLSR